MIKSEIIRKRLLKLNEYLVFLQRMQSCNLEEFVNNPEKYGSTERFLHLSIEAIIDIGGHIIAAKGLGEVDWYSDIPRILAEKGYIDNNLREKWIQIIGFRNVLVHDYLEVDREIVHQVLQNDLDDLETLKDFFAQFL